VSGDHDYVLVLGVTEWSVCLAIMIMC